MRTGQSPLTLHVIGGLLGIIQNEKALDKFFFIAPELSMLLHEFAAECVCQCQKRQKHNNIYDISQALSNDHDEECGN